MYICIYEENALFHKQCNAVELMGESTIFAKKVPTWPTIL